MVETTKTVDADAGGAIPQHPFFDRFGPHSALDCLDAIDRIACVIDMFNHLNLSNDTDGGLSSRAAFGYAWLSESMQTTLIYCSRRLVTLGRKQHDEAQDSASLSILASSVTLTVYTCHHCLTSSGCMLRRISSKEDRTRLILTTTMTAPMKASVTPTLVEESLLPKRSSVVCSASPTTASRMPPPSSMPPSIVIEMMIRIQIGDAALIASAI